MNKILLTFLFTIVGVLVVEPARASIGPLNALLPHDVKLQENLNYSFVIVLRIPVAESDSFKKSQGPYKGLGFTEFNARMRGLGLANQPFPNDIHDFLQLLYKGPLDPQDSGVMDQLVELTDLYHKNISIEVEEKKDRPNGDTPDVRFIVLAHLLERAARSALPAVQDPPRAFDGGGINIKISPTANIAPPCPEGVLESVCRQNNMQVSLPNSENFEVNMELPARYRSSIAVPNPTPYEGDPNRVSGDPRTHWSHFRFMTALWNAIRDRNVIPDGESLFTKMQIARLAWSIIKAGENGSYNTQAVSHDKSGNPVAYGLGQIIPATGLSACGLTRDQLMDGDQNLRCSVKYIYSLYKSFDGKPEHVVAAYETGPKRVQTALARGLEDGVDPSADEGHSRPYHNHVMDWFRNHMPDFSIFNS